MTAAIEIDRQVEKSLSEFEDTYDITRACLSREDTAELNFEQWASTFWQFFQLVDATKLEFLMKFYEQRSEIVHTVVGFLKTAKTDTVDIEPWPVAPSFPEPVSHACVEFCDSHGLNSILRMCLKKVREIFSNITRVYAELDHFRDDEPGDIGHIVIRVEVESNQPTALAEYDKWVNWVILEIPPEQRNFFTLTVRRV